MWSRRLGVLLILLMVAGIIVGVQHSHHRHHRLKAKIVVDGRGRACYLDHSKGRIYYYVLDHGSGDYYVPTSYDTPGRVRSTCPKAELLFLLPNRHQPRKRRPLRARKRWPRNTDRMCRRWWKRRRTKSPPGRTKAGLSRRAMPKPATSLVMPPMAAAAGEIDPWPPEATCRKTLCRYDLVTPAYGGHHVDFIARKRARLGVPA